MIYRIGDGNSVETHPTWPPAATEFVLSNADGDVISTTRRWGQDAADVLFLLNLLDRAQGVIA